jgi:hypothetical protein
MTTLLMNIRTWGTLGIWVAASLVSASAVAEDDGFVVADDDEPADEGPARRPAEGVAAPAEGASEAEIFAYIRALKKDVRDAQRELKEAKRDGDSAEVARLTDELRDKKLTLSDEESRLTTSDPGLVAGGAVLTGLGGVSLLSGLVLLFVWPLTAIDGHVNDEYGYAALGCAAGGVVGLGAGIPMIVVGKRKEVRYPDEEALAPPDGDYVGLTFGGTF